MNDIIIEVFTLIEVPSKKKTQSDQTIFKIAGIVVQIGQSNEPVFQNPRKIWQHGQSCEFSALSSWFF